MFLTAWTDVLLFELSGDPLTYITAFKTLSLK